MRINRWLIGCAFWTVACGSHACSGASNSNAGLTDNSAALQPGDQSPGTSTPDVPDDKTVAAPMPAAPAVAAPITADDGWTRFDAGPNTRGVYVSNQGQDDWPGTEEQPKASLQAGYEMLRDGSADWLLLRRGDRFVVREMFMWSKSGPHGRGVGSMRLAAYGDEAKPRPVIDSGSESAMVISPGYRSDRVIENLAITDVHFVASARLANPKAAQPDRVAVQTIAVEHRGASNPFAHLLFENVMIEGFSAGISTSGDVEHLALRRNIFYRLFSPGGAGVHSSALIANPRGSLLLEGNVFYLCQYPGMPGVTEFSYFSHSAYIGVGAQNVIVRGNFIIKAFEGIMQRAGGVYEHNVSAHNALAFHLGEAIGVTPSEGGVEAWVRGNLMLNNDGGPNVGNTRAAEIVDNLIINDRQGPQATPNMTLIGRNDQNGGGRMLGTNIGVHHATIKRNHFAGNLVYAADRQDPRHYSDVVFSGNVTGVGRASASIEGYLAQQGWSGTTIDDFAKRLVASDRNNYAAANATLPLINYYRAALQLPPLN